MSIFLIKIILLFIFREKNVEVQYWMPRLSMYNLVVKGNKVKQKQAQQAIQVYI